MTFTETDLHTIAGRARTIEERIQSKDGGTTENRPFNAQNLLEQWEAMYDSEAEFGTRLKAAGISREDVKAEASNDLWPDSEPLPEWTDELNDLQRYIGTNTPDCEILSHLDEDVPFRDILATIGSYGMETTTGVPIGENKDLSEINWLVSRIRAISARVLYVEFKSYVEHFNPKLAASPPEDFNEYPTDLYDQFIDDMHGDGFRNLCLEYPILARQIITVIRNWRDAMTELKDRLLEDHAALENTLEIDGHVVKIEPLADDSHAGGRVPMRIKFDVGSVVYKPRPVALGTVFHHIVEQISTRLDIDFGSAPNYVERDGYGWMEYVPSHELPSGTSASAYYRRSGILIFCSYLTNFNDIQFENIVASGEYPRIIDCETVFHPPLSTDILPFHYPEAVFQLRTNSVLNTELLPWSVGQSNSSLSSKTRGVGSGLGATGEEISITSETHSVFKAPNTDVMTVDKTNPTFDTSTTVPNDGSKYHSAEEYVDDIVEGFDEAYRLVEELRQNDEFYRKIMPPTSIDDISVRCLLRPTSIYGNILRSACSRDALRDGFRYSIELDELAVPLIEDADGVPENWPVFKSEVEAMLRRDIPRFNRRSREDCLRHDRQQIDVEVEKSGQTVFRNRLDSLGHADRNRQIALIRQSLESSNPSPPPKEPRPIREEGIPDLAESLFNEVIRSRIQTPNGVKWISAREIDGQLNLITTDKSLYDGIGGIAVTAAALHTAADKQLYRELAVDLTNDLLNHYEVNIDNPEHGGMRGIGSVVYTAAAVSDLIEEPSFTQRAIQLCEAQWGDMNDSSAKTGVLDGIAGTLLGLLAIYERTGEPSLLNKAITCGERLLKQRSTIDGVKLWRIGDERGPQPGFAHGLDGIGYSLAKLGAATGENRWGDVVSDIFAYTENRNEATSNQSFHMTADGTEWCWGSAGVLLSRLGAPDTHADCSLGTFTHQIVKSYMDSPVAKYDHLCCGNFGIVEALLVASESGYSTLEMAHAIAGRCMARRESESSLELPGHSRHFINPTLFNGISGITYELLRLHSPDELPSVMLLE